MKHTKGEWEVGGLDQTKVWSSLPNGMKTCVAWSTNQAQARHYYLDKDYHEMIANAKLIAAAPKVIRHLILAVKSDVLPLELHRECVKVIIDALDIRPEEFESIKKATS